MPSLHELQRAFCAAVLTGDTAGIEVHIRADGIPAARRMQIYRNNAEAAFVATLAATFPVVERLGGSDWFRQSALEYQHRHPSRSGDLQFIGDRYADFLRARFAGSEFAYFGDVAALEWAYQEVLIAPESVALDPARLGDVAEDDHGRIVFRLRPDARIVESVHPIFAIWQFNRRSGGQADDGVPELLSLDAGPSRVLVIRRNDSIEVREVPAAAATLFRELSRDTTFAGALEAFSEVHSITEFGAALRTLMSLEAIADFRLNQPEVKQS